MVLNNAKDGAYRIGTKASSRTFNPLRSPSMPTGTDKLKKKTAAAVAASPEKPESPEDAQESLKSLVINNDEIQQLSIKDEDLEKLRLSLEPPVFPKDYLGQSKSFTVRKPKPHEQVLLQQKTKKIIVAKHAPSDAQPKPPDQMVPAGPRYTKDGHIIAHSILGSVHNFVDEAIRREDMRVDSPAVLDIQSQGQQQLEAKKYHRPATHHFDAIPIAMDQENALVNWRRKMADRKRQQGYISSLLQKPLDRLVMNQDDLYRSMQETRKLVDRSIAPVDYGKGYRVGSEFWHQYENFGDDVGGIKMSLTKTEQGKPVEFEHIGKPLSVRYETGTARSGERPTVDPRRTWHASRYLQRRTKQLRAIMKKLDPCEPDFINLEVVGSDAMTTRDTQRRFDDDVDGYGEPYPGFDENDPLLQFPDVISEPFIGPSLVFGGTSAKWSGSSDDCEDQVGVIARVTFETVATKQASSHLVVKNDGTTAIYYEWRKVPTPPSFDSLKPSSVQRFYFNTKDGVILPGDTTTFPFVFKSPNAGIFTETWQFVTRPTVIGGAALHVILKGVALQDDSQPSEERKKIEAKLAKRAAVVAVQTILDDIVRGIQSPDRSPSPLDAYITEEEIFIRKNPGRSYDHQTVMELKNIYLQLFAEEDRQGKEWNLSLDELQLCVSAIPEEEAREELLSGLNTVINRLSFPPPAPSQRLMHSVGLQLWQDTIDKIAGCSMMVRKIMGLPEIVMNEVDAEPEPPAVAASLPVPTKPDPKEQYLLKPSESLWDKADDKKKGKKGTGKDDKGKKGGKKERPKSSRSKGAKGAVSSSPSKDTQQERDIGSKTPSSIPAIQTDNLDPATRNKYTEKMYGQVYVLLVEMVDAMSLAFEEVKSQS